jgi:transglutaminase-like putative cysteine protease
MNKSLIPNRRGASYKIAVASFLFLLTVTSIFSVGFASAAATYSITIYSKYNNVSNSVNVPITEDGVPTGFSTPHTFSGLSGTHNFTVPYEDSSGHPFRAWDIRAPSDSAFNTLNVSSIGVYWAFYDSHVPRNNGGGVDYVSPAEQRYYVTPSDSAVIAATGNKSWSDIINWVASQITYNYNTTIWQFPNETLALGSGQCREYATLCVSMLLSRGYIAYVVTGNITQESGMNTNLANGHAWIVIQLNDTFYHFEPQRTWAGQPSPVNFTSGYIAQYYVDNFGLYPHGTSENPPAAETYDLTINTSYNGVSDIVNVAIAMDGLPTGFNTPYTFAGLKGAHNITVPYTDISGHPFMSWGTNYPGESRYATIPFSSGGVFTAYYETEFNRNSLYDAERMYLITPTDPAIVAAAANKSWNEILDLVSAVPRPATTGLQFPNQTLAKGSRYFADCASLFCSMLRSRGYTAYMVKGTSEEADAWVVLNLNGTFIHLDSYYPWKEQQTLNFESYQPSFYVDEKGIYPAGVSVDPPLKLPDATPAPSLMPKVPMLSLICVLAAVLLVVSLAVIVWKRKTSLKKRD